MAAILDAILNCLVTRSTQPCIPPGSLNRVPASAGGKGGNVTSAGWQVTLCDPIWHVSSRSGVTTLRTAIHLLLTYLLTYLTGKVSIWKLLLRVSGVWNPVIHSKLFWSIFHRKGMMFAPQEFATI